MEGVRWTPVFSFLSRKKKEIVPAHLVLVDWKAIQFPRKGVSVCCWKVLTVCVFWCIRKCCLNTELGQIEGKYLWCLCCCQLPVTTTAMAAFIAGTWNLFLSSLVTGFRVAGVQMPFFVWITLQLSYAPLFYWKASSTAKIWLPFH